MTFRIVQEMKNIKKLIIVLFLVFHSSIEVNANESNLLPISPKRVDSTRSQSDPTEFFSINQNDKKCVDFPLRDSFLYVLKGKTIAKAGFPFFSSSASSEEAIIIQEYSLYDMVDNERVGIGVRLLITVKTKKFNAGTLSIPFLTLNAERGKLEAKVHLQTIGIKSDKLPHLESPIELNFTTLTNMYQQMNDIKKVICSDDTKLDSYVLAKPLQENSNSEDGNGKN